MALNVEIKLQTLLDETKLKAQIDKIEKLFGANKISFKKTEDELDDVAKSARKAADNIDNISKQSKQAESSASGLSKAFSGVSGVLGGLAIGATFLAGINEAITKGQEFQQGLAMLSSITGVSGDGLINLGEKAKSLAAEFGGSAADNLTAFQGILSKLGGQVADTPAALESMTRSVNILSAATGDDAVASMDALTSSVLQFQVPLNDSVVAADEMSKMMNVLAAGAKFGAAEVPEIADAIKVAGVAASGAKVSFEETNASLQALAAGGKTGAEAGTALRNVLGTLEKGRFLPKDTLSELQAAGVNIDVLSDKNLSLTDRLRELEKVQGDAALMSKLFGTENQAAGAILLRSVDSIDKMTVQLTGTNTATEQAAINQKTFAAQLAQTKAAVENNLINTFTKIEPALTSTLSVVASVVGTVFNTVGTVVSFLVDTISTAAPVLVLAGGAMIAYAIATNTTAIVLGAAAAAQGILNAVMLINPAVAIIAGIIALVGAYKLLTDAMIVTTEEKLDNAKASDEIIQKQRTETAEQLKTAKSATILTDEYKKLIEKKKLTRGETERLKQMNSQLNDKYPDLIKNTTNYKENLSGLDTIAAQQTAAIGKFSKQMAELDKQARESAKNISQLNSDVARGALNDNIAAVFNNAVNSLTHIDSDKAVAAKERFTKEIAEIYNIKDENQFKLRFAQIQKTFTDSLGEINPQKKLALITSFDTFKEKQLAVIKLNNGEIVKAIDDGGKKQTDAIAKTGDSAEDIKKKLKEKADKTRAELKELRDAELQLEEDAIKNLDDSLAKRERVYNLSITKQRNAIQDELDTVQLNELGKARKKFSDAETKTIEAQNTRLLLVNENYEKGLTEVRTKFADEDSKKKNEQRKKDLQGEIDSLKISADAIKGESLKLAGEKLSYQLDILKKERELNLIGLDTNSTEYLNKIREYANKEIELRKDIRNNEIAQDITDDVSLSLEERLHKIKMLQLKSQFDEKLKLVKGSKADELAATIEYAKLKNAEEDNYNNKTITGFSAFTTLKDSIAENFKKLGEQRNSEEFKSKQNQLDDESDALRDKIKNDSISYDDYIAQVSDIAKRRAELEEDTYTITDALRSASVAALTDASQQYKDKAKTTQSDYEALLTSGLATEAEIKTKRTQLIEETAISAGATLASMAAAGTLTLQAFGATVIDAAFSVVAKQLQIAIVGALFTEASSKGIFGLITGAVVGVALTAAFSGLKSIIGRKDGEVLLRGAGTETSDDIPRLLSVNESVITAKGSKNNTDLLRWINKTGLSAEHYFKSKDASVIVINQQGKLDRDDTSAAILQQTAQLQNSFNQLSSEVQKLQKSFYHKTETRLAPVKMELKGADLHASIQQEKKRKLK